MNPRMTGEFVRSRKTFLTGRKSTGKRFLSGVGAYVSCLGSGKSGVKGGLGAGQDSKDIPDARDEKRPYHKGDTDTCMA
jgi:hypothetical protein